MDRINHYIAAWLSETNPAVFLPVTSDHFYALKMTDFYIYERVIINTNLSICSEVHKAQERSTGRFVALKKVRMENEKEGFPMTALREIRILQLLKHENVMELIEICRSRGIDENLFI